MKKSSLPIVLLFCLPLVLLVTMVSCKRPDPTTDLKQHAADLQSQIASAQASLTAQTQTGKYKLSEKQLDLITVARREFILSNLNLAKVATAIRKENNWPDTVEYDFQSDQYRDKQDAVTNPPAADKGTTPNTPKPVRKR